MDTTGMGATEKRIFIAVGPNVWGKGFTEEQALTAMHNVSGSKVRQWILYVCTDPWAYVNYMGNVCAMADSVVFTIKKHVFPADKKG
jgi:hypothetical protein